MLFVTAVLLYLFFFSESENFKCRLGVKWEEHKAPWSHCPMASLGFNRNPSQGEIKFPQREPPSPELRLPCPVNLVNQGNENKYILLLLSFLKVLLVKIVIIIRTFSISQHHHHYWHRNNNNNKTYFIYKTIKEIKNEWNHSR